MPLREELGGLNLEPRINLYHQKLFVQKIDYYSMMEISKTATSREIDAAFRNFSALFPLDQIANIRGDDTRRKADQIVNKLRRAYDTLNDFAKRADYEKKGFRDADDIEVRDDPIDRARTLYRKSQTLHQHREFRSAIVGMKEAIALDPKTPSYYFLLGLCQSEIPSMTQEAEKNLQKATEMEEWNAEPVVALGLLFYKVKLYKRAEVFFRRALTIEASHPVARKKLEEICGPEKKSFSAMLKALLAPLRGLLARIMPTFFGEKKR